MFYSVFKDEFQDLIEMKRATGFKYSSEELGFKRMDLFFIDNQLSKKEISRELAEKWCSKKSYETEANRNNRISQFRVFSSYLSDIGMKTYIPPKGMTKHPPKYDAHIYTDNELKRFFSATDKCAIVPSECPFRHLVMPIFFRILYTSGLRVSELRLLKINEFDLSNGYLTIKNGKNKKDRIIPVHSDLVAKCVEFKKIAHKSSAADEYFFMIHPGRPMTLQNLYHNFRRFLEKSDISHTGKGPRIHDFRYPNHLKIQTFSVVLC